MMANTLILLFVTRYKILADLPGHSSISHSWISVDFPSQTPPLASSINFVLLLSLVLTPQVAEHSPIVQLPHTQWIAVIPRISSFHSYYDCIWFYKYRMPIMRIESKLTWTGFCVTADCSFLYHGITLSSIQVISLFGSCIHAISSITTSATFS